MAAPAIAAGTAGGAQQPVYGIDGRVQLHENEVPALDGYRGMGPVGPGILNGC